LIDTAGSYLEKNYHFHIWPSMEPLRHHSAAHTAERRCCSREPLTGRKVHRGAICGGASRAFRSQAADSVSAMSACARALR
jgi:hypothetical protein